MKKIFNIFKSELKEVFTDQGTILIMVGAIFLYGIFYMVPFSKQMLRDVPIAVVDLDNSSLSREFIRDLNSNEMIEISSRPISIEDAQEEYYQNKIRAYIVIPKDFEKDVLRGGNSFISAYEDSAFLIIYKQIATGLATTVSSLDAKIEVGSFMKKGLSKEQSINIKLPFDFVQLPLYNPIGSYQNYIYPLILVLILQQTMLLGVGMLGGTIKEKLRGINIWSEDGKIVEVKQEKVSEFSDNPMEIVLGKSLAYVLIYFIYSLIYFLVFPAFVVYDMTYNPSMFIILIPFLFAVAFLGQAMVYFYAERENSLFILIVTSVPMLFQPGFVWPKECIPMWLKCISYFIPTTPAMDGLTRINQMGASFYQVQGDFWQLILLCCLFFFLACKVTFNMNRCSAKEC